MSSIASLRQLAPGVPSDQGFAPSCGGIDGVAPRPAITLWHGFVSLPGVIRHDGPCEDWVRKRSADFGRLRRVRAKLRTLPRLVCDRVRRAVDGALARNVVGPKLERIFCVRFGFAKAAHSTLAFACRLVAVLRPVA